MDLFEPFTQLLAVLLHWIGKRPVIYQDNTAVISAVTEGCGATRTKSIHQRLNIVLEAMQERVLKLKALTKRKWT